MAAARFSSASSWTLRASADLAPADALASALASAFTSALASALTSPFTSDLAGDMASALAALAASLLAPALVPDCVSVLVSAAAVALPSPGRFDAPGPLVTTTSLLGIWIEMSASSGFLSTSNTIGKMITATNASAIAPIRRRRARRFRVESSASAGVAMRCGGLQNLHYVGDREEGAEHQNSIILPCAAACCTICGSGIVV